METTTESIKAAKERSRCNHIINSSKRIHRRRMAYIAMAAIIVVTYWCIFKVPEKKLDVLEEIISWFYITMGSIIGAYVGFATLDDKWTVKKKDDTEEK